MSITIRKRLPVSVRERATAVNIVRFIEEVKHDFQCLFPPDHPLFVKYNNPVQITANLCGLHRNTITRCVKFNEDKVQQHQQQQQQPQQPQDDQTATFIKVEYSEIADESSRSSHSNSTSLMATAPAEETETNGSSSNDEELKIPADLDLDLIIPKIEGQTIPTNDGNVETETDSEVNIDPLLVLKKPRLRSFIQCDLCLRKFLKLSSLNNHLQKIHPGCLKCHFCPQNFTTKFRLAFHQKSKHSSEIAATLQMSSQDSNSPNNYTDLLNNHYQPQPQHECKICGSILKCRSSLNRHMRLIHLGGDNPYKCYHCPKTFWDSDCFKKHVLGCAPDKSLFKCTFCPKSYGFRQSLLDHLGREHREGKGKGHGDFKCELCSKKFMTELGLKTHVGLIHLHETENLKDSGDTNNSRKFPCPSCPKVFEKLARLRAHMKIVHKKVQVFLEYLEEDVNGATAVSPKTLKVAKVESAFPESDEVTSTSTEGQSPNEAAWLFPCSVKDCNLTFTRASALLVHEKQHRKAEWICKVCLRLFSRNYLLKRHMVIHTGESKHKCPLCTKVFTKRNGLTTHLALHDRQSVKMDEDQVPPEIMMTDADAEERPAQINCPYCARICFTVWELRMHLKECR